MNYKNKLKDPRWIQFKQQVYKKDNYKCSNNCGWTKDRGIPLVAHHTVYYMEDGMFVDPWNYLLDEMQTLCNTCHEIHHIDFGIDAPIYDKKTGRLINEDDNTRKTRIKVETMKSQERDLIKK